MMDDHTNPHHSHNLESPSNPSPSHNHHHHQHPQDHNQPSLITHQQMFGSSKMPFSTFNLYSGGDFGEPRDCESEEGAGISEEQVKPVRPRGSGSKRSRAAEVHNLSEKRRRSRINEKMKALQSLIPNSNKTDKASMLDEAIEYLKQLQLQVQMLSMRNGLYLHPSYLSGALEPVQASQMCAALGGNNGTGSNPGVVMLPVSQSSGAQHSFDPLNPRAQNHPPLVLPSVPNITVPEPSFHVESSQSHLGSFQLPESAEMIFREEIMPKHQLTSGQQTRSLPENEMKSIRHPSSIVNSDHFDGCALSEERSQDMVPKNTDNIMFMPQLHSVQSGDTEVDVKAGSK